MRGTIPFLISALVLVPQAALAQKAATDTTVTTTSVPGKASISATVEIQATVVAVDPKTRVVTLKGPKGNTMDVVCGEEVRNFDQIKVGDNVSVQYVEAFSLELKKAKGPADAKQVTETARAPAGGTPAGAAGQQTTVTTDVVAIDAAKMVVSLKGPAGKTVDLKVKDPNQFKLIKVGDQVEAVYTQALAVAVTPKAK